MLILQHKAQLGLGVGLRLLVERIKEEYMGQANLLQTQVQAVASGANYLLPLLVLRMLRTSDKD